MFIYNQGCVASGSGLSSHALGRRESCLDIGASRPVSVARSKTGGSAIKAVPAWDSMDIETRQVDQVQA